MTGRQPAFAPGARVAVLGLGVSGVAAARLAAARGGEVYASDASGDAGPAAAAAALRVEGVRAEAGRHDLEWICGADLVVASPGISPFSGVRRAVSEAGVRTIAEVELGFAYLRGRIIGITGTNGKTTTTRLAAHLLRGAGIAAEPVGNVGRPLCDLALAPDPPEWFVVELSSFQLADLERFEVDVGVLLNLASDHLDRYRDLQSYFADKARLFACGRPDTAWVLNGDDDAVQELAAGAGGTRYAFSVRGEVARGAWRAADGTLQSRMGPDAGAAPRPWAVASDLRVPGAHNVGNALAACLAAALSGADPASFAGSLRGFEGLPHRLQTVAERGGVTWVDDSKATNVAATVAALDAFERPVVLLLGGRHKGEPYTPIGRAAAGLRGVVAYGEAAPRIVADLQGEVGTLVVESGMDAVVRAADRLARPGDVVLLAPACSSFDMFPDYAARGRAFAAAVRALAGQGAAT
ncbi:MAG: UDP-N-acetylmuramoyl-L-alanine--D-glutamate ligase [Gemmatimonadota bacterium]|nr:UDP-N-acetylmuramoyl-L-alanine--D-glutamate ligase [Gemmatimonadota bacterium]